MTKIEYVKGDATQPIGDGKKLLIHCCNNCVPGKWGAGFVVALSKRWKQPEVQYRKWSKGYCEGALYQLGEVQFVKVEDDIVIGNMIGQDGVGTSHGIPPIRYSAIVQCLYKVKEAAIHNKASVHCPRFGAGLAGGDWNKIEEIIKSTMEVDTYVYTLPNQKDKWKGTAYENWD